METHDSPKPEFVRLADELDGLNKSANSGKGIEHITSIVNHLRRGYTYDARLEISTSSFDKFGSSPEIKDWVIKNLFNDYKHPWETNEDFYERMSHRKIITVDTTFNENEGTPNGIRQNLLKKGYQEYPPINLTTTKFSREAKFEKDIIKTPEEALDDVLKEVEKQARKKFIGSVMVRLIDQGQQIAHVFFKTEVKSQNTTPGWNTGTTIWTESDGALVGKAEVNKKNGREGIDVSVLKRRLPNIAEEVDELIHSSNLPSVVTESKNPDYITFRIETDRAHNANLAFDSIKGLLGSWLK